MKYIRMGIDIKNVQVSAATKIGNEYCLLIGFQEGVFCLHGTKEEVKDLIANISESLNTIDG